MRKPITADPTHLHRGTAPPTHGDHDTMTDAQIIDAAAAKLGPERHPSTAYGTDGPVGLVYYGEETRRWYAVDLDSCRTLAEMTGEDVYSRWCAEPSAQPIGEGGTKYAALNVAVAFTMTPWSLRAPVAQGGEP